MTEEQEQMLRAVLRNQEVIMNAIAELLTGSPDGQEKERRRENTLMELGTCVGITHYYLEDLRRIQGYAKN